MTAGFGRGAWPYIDAVAMPGPLRRAPARDLVLTGAGLLGGAVAGMAIAGQGDLGLALAAGFVLAAVAIARPVVVAIMAVPGMYLVGAARRQPRPPSPAATTGVAYSDVLLAGATALALVFSVPRGRRPAAGAAARGRRRSTSPACCRH